jgi:hypothetical protein
MDYAGIGAGHAGRRDLVILLDDSLSMRATPSLGSVSGRSAFDRARELAIDTLSNLVNIRAELERQGVSLNEETPAANKPDVAVSGMVQGIADGKPSENQDSAGA